MALTIEHASNYIVVLNYNSWQDTIECVEAIINSTYKNFQIIIIDNKSTNDSEQNILNYLEGNIFPNIENSFFKEKIRKRKQKLPYVYYRKVIENTSFFREKASKKSLSFILEFPIIFLQTEKNLGFAGGNNLALKPIIDNDNISSCSKVFLLNPDTFIDSKALFFLNKTKDDTFIKGCFVKDYYLPHKRGFLGAYRIIKPFGVIKNINTKSKEEIDYIYGGALYTNKRTLEKSGLLPEDYFLYWEETDWCYSAKLNGVNLSTCEEAIVYDKVGTSIGRGYLAYYYFIRNGLLFFNKYHKKNIFFLLVFITYMVLSKIVKLEFNNSKAIIDGTKDYFRGKKGYKSIS